MESKAKRASFSLEEEYHELFREISRRSRRSMTDELRILIDFRAQTLGIEPVNPVDPKSLASGLEMALN